MISNFDWKKALAFVGGPLIVVVAAPASGAALGWDARSVQVLVSFAVISVLGLVGLGIYTRRLERRRRHLEEERGVAVLADVRLEESAHREFAIAAGVADPEPQHGTFALTVRPGALELWTRAEGAVPHLTVPAGAVLEISIPHPRAATLGAEVEVTFTDRPEFPVLVLVVGSWGGLFLRTSQFEEMIVEMRRAVDLEV